MAPLFGVDETNNSIAILIASIALLFFLLSRGRGWRLLAWRGSKMLCLQKHWRGYGYEQ